MVVQRRARRARGGRAPDPGRVRRRPRGRRHAGRLRRRRPGADAVGGRGARRAGSGRGRGTRSRSVGRRAEGAAIRRMGAARRDLEAERRALDRLEPRAQLATSRERAGLLLDRAARVVDERLAAAQRSAGADRGRGSRPCCRPASTPSAAGGRRSAVRAPRTVELRLATAATSLAAPRASLGALGPQATLERGYAIVRRAATARSCGGRTTRRRARRSASPWPRAGSPRRATGARRRWGRGAP